MALADKKQSFEELRAEVSRANEEYKRARAECAAKNEVALREAPIWDENREPLPLRAELDSLGKETLDEVEVAIEECEAKANSIVANPDVIRQYEARKREIEHLAATVEQMVQEEADKTTQLDRKRQRWEKDLNDQIAVMNALFSKYMSDMGNVGALELYRGEPPAETSGNEPAAAGAAAGYGSFKDWGIKIRVGFRGSEKAQVLSAQSHSGGERAVSTIMYLMAAQDMLVSPFRCVGTCRCGCR
jgi:structural maintenance of chromosomes protein 5